MATKGIEMQTIECPVCHENYNEPKILPCAHLLCRRCLVSLMKKKRDVLCPLCSSAIVDSQDSTSKSCEDFIDSMPTDHVMSAMVESVKVLFCEKHVCHVHRDVVATILCMKCRVKLCQSCVDSHKIITVRSSHKLEDLSTLTLEELTASRHEPCSEHPDKISELFCTRHNVLICHLCSALQHRACPEVTGLNEMYDKYKQLLSDFKAKLNITISSLEQAITRIEEHLVQTEKNMKVTFAEIDKTCDSLVNSVETCRTRLKKLVQDADDKNKDTALEHKSSLGERRGRLTSHLELIYRMQQMANSSSLVAMVPKLESYIAKLHLDTTLPEEAGQGLKMVSLTIDPNASVCVKSELDKIGNLMVSSATIQDESVTRTRVQDSPNSNLTSTCRVSIPNELLQGSDPEACLKNKLLKSPDVRISKTEHEVIFSVSYDCLVKLATTIQEQITNTVVMLKDNSQNQITHRASTTEINSLEFEAMQHLLSPDFFQHFNKVKEDGEKVAITSDNHESMEKFKEMYNSIRQEKVKLAQDEVSCLEKSADFLLEDVDAFIKVLPSESKIVIICFDYNAMTKAKHLINVKVGKVKITQRNKRKFEGGAKESTEMVAHQTSLIAVNHTDSNSGPSYIKHKDFATKSGIQVSVYKADITQLTVDVIVNAANRDLKHDGGVAYAIARAAGPRLELEGDDYVKTKGQLNVTEVVPTTAGNLPCRKVLHAVGPRWDDYQNKEQCQHDLEQTVFTCLEKAHNLRFSSIALSSISSAIFGVPKKMCAQMYLAAVQRFEQQLGMITNLKHLHFVDINDEMVDRIQDTFTALWDTPVQPPSIQPSISPIRSPKLDSTSILPHSVVADEEQHKMNKSNFHFPERSKVFITKSGINVFVYKGDIEQLSVDAIAIDGRFPKASGVTFSDKILKVRGLRSKSDVQPIVTNVMIPAGNLLCKNVLWATGSSYNDSLRNAQLEHDLMQTFLDCLTEAHKQKFTSIALCDGISAFLDVCRDSSTLFVYVRAIQQFEKDHTGATSLQQIHIVSTDDSVVSIIQNLFSTVWIKSYVPVTIPQFESESRSCEVGSKSFTVTPPSPGNNLDEVHHKRGMSDIPFPENCKTFTTLSGINVSIYKADITKLAVDIIVSAADEGLTRGAGVSRAIEMAAGSALLDEKRKYMRKHGRLEVTNVVMTTAGELLCKKVLHAVGPREYLPHNSQFQDRLVQTVLNCLRTTQDQGDRSVAFTSISSVVADAPKEVCARMYLAAVKKFEKEYGGKTSVRNIHFVDINDAMVGIIQETFERYWDTSVTQDDSHQTANDLKRNHRDQRSSLATQSTNATGVRFPLFWDSNINHAQKLELSYLVEFPKLKLYIKQADVNDVHSGAIVFWQTNIKTPLEEPVKNYVTKKGERYPTEEIQKLKRGFTRNSTVEKIILCSDLTLIFSVNPSFMTGAFVEERIRSILNTAGNSNFKISIPVPVDFTAAGGGNRKSLEQFAVGVYMAVEIYANKMDKSVIEVNVIDTDEKTIRLMGEIIQKIAQDKSLTSAQNQNTSSYAASAGKMLAVDDKKCAFCSLKINNDLEHFSCGHGFCTQCIGDNFQQNPGCLICSNKHQLKGSMNIYYSDLKLEGFEDFGSFVITYHISSGTLMDKGHLHKRYSSADEMAFLPNSENGRKVLMLLKVAWACGFTFTLSESGTRFKVVWNGIEHKTLRKGGQSNGYPDQDYLNRVQQQLKARGVTEKALSDAQKDFILHPEHFLKSSSLTGDFIYP